MTDLANLVLAVDSSSVPKGTAELDKLTAAGARAETSAQRVTKATNQQAVATRNVAQASGQARAGMQQLGFQVGDVAAQYSAGTRPAQIFAQQIGQVMQAVQLTAGSTGKLASFLTGPWGLAVSVGASVTAILVSRLLQGKEAAKDKKTALEELRDAIDDYGKATGKASQAEGVQIRLLDAAAQAMLNKATATREATKALLEQTRAQLIKDRSDTTSPDFNRQFRIQTGDEATRALDALVIQQDRAVQAARTLALQNAAPRIILDVAAATDKVAAATQRYELRLFSLNKKFTEGRISEAAFREALTAATKTRDAAIAAANKHEKADNSAAKAAREAAKAAREHAKDLRDLQSTYEDLERQFDPAAAKAREFMESMKNIETVRLAGLIDDGKALNFLLAAVFGQAYSLEKILEKLQNGAGFDPTKSLTDQLGIDARGDAGADAARAAQDEFLQGLDDMVARSEDAATAMANAFGRAGEGIAGLVVAMADYKKASAIVHDQTARFGAADMASTEALKRAEIARNGALISGVKSLFKEHSSAYKAMEVVEKAYAALQLVNAVKAMAVDSAQTASSVSNSMARGAADQAAGAAKIFSMLGPFGFPVVAAMVAVLASLGLKGGGGGSSGKAPSAEDLQTKQGTGTVLGDPTAKSASIANSIEILARNSSKGLDHSAQMVRSLHKIETGIGALASALARQLNLAGGSFDTAGLGLGSKTKAPLDAILGIGMLGPIGLITGNLVMKIPVIGDILKGISKVLFNVKTTVTLLDQGIQFNAQAIDEILRSGVDGFSYQTIEIKKKKKLLGISVGGSTKTQDVTGALDGEVERQIGLIIGDLYSTVVEAARIIGLDVGDALKTFQVEIGKISLKDLKGDEITAALQSIFSKVADEMAGFAVAGVEQFQKAGEGLFETLTRLAKDYLTIDAVLSSVGLSFGAVGASSIGAREALIDLSGGLDQFVDSVSFYQQNFLTEAERIALAQVSVSGAMQSLGLASVTTIDQFKSVVSGLDLTSAAGQELFTSLMAIAPAFFQVASAADAVARARGQLNIQLLQALGQSEAALTAQRGLELQALDASLRPLQLQVWAAQDAAKAMDDAARATQAASQAAAQAAQDAGRAEADAIQRVDQAKSNLLTSYHRERDALEGVSSRFRSFGDDLRAFRDSLTVQSGAMSRSQALVSLMKVGGLAGAGNEQAMGQLPGTAREFLDISRAGASSLQQYQRDVALVASYVGAGISAADRQVSNAESQLAALDRQVGRLVDINDGVVSVREAIWRLQSAQNDQANAAAAAAQARENAAAAAREADRVANEKLVVTNEAIAMRLATLERIFKNAERNGALAVTGDADAPVYTSAV